MNELTSEDVKCLNALLARLVRNSSYCRSPEEVKPKPSPKVPAKDQVLRDLLAGYSKKYASDAGLQRPSDADLRRMYDVVQADANLTKRIAGLGFGNTGDAYRKAAIKLHILAIMNVLRDGKNIRNDIVHKPGYIPSEQSTSRAIQEYAQADQGISDFLNRKA